MLETFTPAVCGSRKRQIVAQALFAVAAVVDVRACSGSLLGLAGSLLGARQAVFAAAALALLAAAREAGLVRFPLPQARRQVPERWRFELPLPVWATRLRRGPRRRLLHVPAGLDVLGRLRGRPRARAARSRPRSASRSTVPGGPLMVVWPRRRTDDPTAAVERLTRRRGALLRANVVALVACARPPRPRSGGRERHARRRLGARSECQRGRRRVCDARAETSSSGPRRGPTSRYDNASQPALSGEYLAYVDAQGIRVVRWGRQRGGPHCGCQRLPSRARLAQPRLRRARLGRPPADRAESREWTDEASDARCRSASTSDVRPSARADWPGTGCRGGSRGSSS